MRVWQRPASKGERLRQNEYLKIVSAVELIRYAPDTKSTGLLAEATVGVARAWPLVTTPAIPFKEIEGKTLKLLMRMLDDRVDSIVERAKQKWYEENALECEYPTQTS